MKTRWPRSVHTHLTPWISKTEVWISGIFLLAALVFGLISWLHFQQQHALQKEVTELESMRLARIDLNRGILDILQGAEPNSPFNREQGIMLTEQAIQSLNQILSDDITESQSSADALRKSVSAYEMSLTEWEQLSPPPPSQTIRLRIAFSQLENQADEMDDQTQQNLEQLSARLNHEFAVALSLAAVLLGGICGIVFLVGRSKEQSEKALRESEEKFRALFDNNHTPMLLIDPETGGIKNANPAACAFYGWTQVEFLNKTIMDFNISIGEAEILESLQQVVQEKRQSYHFKHRLANHEVRDVEIFTGPIYHNGRPFLYSIIHDITDRKRAEDALSQRNAFIEAILENAPIGFSVNRISDGVSTFVSSKFELIYGVPRGSVIGNGNFFELVYQDPIYREKIRERVMADITSGDPKRMRWENVPITTRTGEQKVVTAINIPVIDQDLMISTVQDMTERKQAEDRIQRQLDYLKALRVIDQTIASTFDLRLSLNTLLAQTISLLAIDATSVLLFNPMDYTLEYAAGLGFRTSAIKTAKIKLGEGLAGRAALERRMIHVPDQPSESKLPLLSVELKGENFVSYYGVPLIAKGKVIGVLQLFHRSFVERDQEWLDFLYTLAGQAAIAIDDAQLFENLQKSNLELRQAYDATIEGWSRALDLRDRETEGHTLRVVEKTLALARQMGMNDAQLIQVHRGALLHDIGKLGVPDGILLKPGPLTDEEWTVMRKHPTFAFDMLSPVKYLSEALDIPYCHHEKWDGTGYPRGLKGDQIPLAARIFTVVDVYDALTSDRPYRSAWTREKALAYIQSLAGAQFDPGVVDAFLQISLLTSSPNPL